MGKMIAVCGSPNSGTTTLSLKLAKYIYDNNKNIKVILVSPDVTIPTLGYIFPKANAKNIFSLGVTLNKTDVFKEDVIKQFVTTNTMRDFAVLGFMLGENRYSYPEPTEDKICVACRISPEANSTLTAREPFRRIERTAVFNFKTPPQVR